MRYFFQLLAFILTVSCSSTIKTPSQKLDDPLKLNVSSFRLGNGLTVLVLEDNRLPVFSLYSYYKVGGKNEQKGLTGASHFLEHLMFKGTKTMSASKFDYLVEGNGGSSNAYTTNDFTVYHENMPTSALDLMLGVEADRMVNLVIKKDEFEQERQVVLEERKMRYENSPKGQLYLTMMEELFRGTPYGTSVIGDIADIRTVSRDQIYAYYKNWYAPNNLTLVVVGDVSASQVKSLVTKHFDSIPSSTVPEASRAMVPDSAFAAQIKAPVSLSLNGQSELPMFMLAMEAGKAGSRAAFAQDILSSILGEGKSSYFVQKYVLSGTPRVASIYAGNYTLEKAGSFMVSGELVKGQDPERFKNDLVKDLKVACKKAITPRSVQKVKNQYAVELYGNLDTSAGLAEFIGQRQSLYGDWAYYRKEWQIYQGLGVKEIQAACNDLTKSGNYVWVTVWSQNKSNRRTER